jgi:hypothetical protein
LGRSAVAARRARAGPWGHRCRSLGAGSCSSPLRCLPAEDSTRSPYRSKRPSDHVARPKLERQRSLDRAIRTRGLEPYLTGRRRLTRVAGAPTSGRHLRLRRPRIGPPGHLDLTRIDGESQLRPLVPRISGRLRREKNLDRAPVPRRAIRRGVGKGARWTSHRRERRTGSTADQGTCQRHAPAGCEERISHCQATPL